MMKKLPAIILTILLTALAVPFSVMAAGTVDEAHCTFTLQENTSSKPYPQSQHNYPNNAYTTWTYSVSGADCLKLVFSEYTYFESGCDYLSIYSVKNGVSRLEKKYTGSSLEGETVIVPGNTVRLLLDTDEDEREWGFRLDEIYAGICSGHDYDEGVVTKAPTCADSGKKTITCRYCSNYYLEEIAPLTTDGIHTLDAGTVTKNPTCADTGIRTRICSLCGAAVEETIPALTTNGVHTLDAGTVTKAPTCVTTGIRTRICSVCSAAVQETIPALSQSLEHTYDYLSPQYPSNTSRSFTCTVCGAQKTTSNFGSCGLSMNYYVFERNFHKTLVIAGNGQMNNYSLNSSSYSTQSTAPWGSGIDEVIFAGNITSIGSYAFYKSEITSADLPDTIESIGAGAFSSSGLTSVSLPDSLKTIGNGAFESAPVDFDRMPAGVRTIGERAFLGTKVTSLVLADRPAGETLTIGMDAFRGIETLTELDLGKGPLEIGAYAFSYCKAISSPLKILGDYTVGGSAFLHCESIETACLEIPELASNLLECCYALREVELVNTVKVNVGVFSGTTSLTSVVFPESTEKLDGTVFNMQIGSGMAPALQSVTFLNRNTSIDSYAFQYASQLTDVYGIDCSTAAAYARNHFLTFHEIGSAEHTFESEDEGTVTKEANCTEEGVLEKKCTFCGAAVRIPIPALGHDWGKPIYGWSEDNGTVTATRVCKRDTSHFETEIAAAQAEVTKPAACEERGVTTWTAVFENEAFSTQTKEEENIEAVGHTGGEPVRENETVPDCTTDGNYEEAVYCVSCGKELSRAVITVPAVGHDWGEWVVLKEATEDTEGLEARACRIDPSHMEQRTIPVLEHVHALIRIEAVEPTCKETGNIGYWTCSGCGKCFLDDAGEQEIEKEETVLAVVEHIWDEGVLTKEATCTEAGEKTYTCIQCGDIYTEIIAAKGHDWDEGTVTKEAACTEAGEKTYTCRNDPAHTKTEEIPALRHKLQHIEAVAATCNTAGNIEYWICERCERIFRDSEESAEILLSDTVTEATGHDWDEGTVTEATCTEPGKKTFTCKNDTVHTRTEDIPVSGHRLIHTEAEAPTCETSGNIEYWMCEKCQKVFSSSEGLDEISINNTIIAAVGHDWDEGTLMKKATCTEAGIRTYTCKNNAAHMYTEEIPATGHAYGANGYCKRCREFIFADVTGSKSKEYVSWAYENGIVKGTGGNSFSPNGSCTRIQFVMMLWKMNGEKTVKGENPFKDITGTKTTKAILWALKEGIINEGEYFNPNDNISRIQIVMMLWKMAGSPAVESTMPFKDVTGARTIKAVKWAYRNGKGITKGTSKTTFSPYNSCTRLQLVIFLYKYNGI